MNNRPIDGFALKEEEGAEIIFRGTIMKVKVSQDDCEDKYSLIEMVHPPNIGPSLHIHPKAPEAYYVLEGDYHIKCGKKSHHVKKGDFVFVPKGTAHNYQSGPNGGKVLVISPPGLEKYFKEVADSLNVGSLTWELEQKIAHRYGQEFINSLKHWGQ